MSGIKILEQSFFDEFEVRGYWKLPDSEHNVPGTLIYKNDGIILEIIGQLNPQENHFSFLDQTLEKNQTSAAVDDDSPKVIWGVSENGEEYTVFSSFQTNSSRNYPGFHVETYLVSEFLAGKLISNVKEYEFASMNMEFTYLSKWLGMNSIDTELLVQGDEYVGRKLATQFPEDNKVELPAIDATLESSGTFKMSNDFFEKAEVTFNSYLKLTPETMKNFEWYTQKMYSLQKLLTLLSGHSIYVKSISFDGEEETIDGPFDKEIKRRKTYKWFYNQNEVNLIEKININDFTIRYPEIKDSFGDIVNNWFVKENNLDVVYELVVSEFYGIPHLTSTFLNFMQAIEVFHRRSYDGKIIEEDEYEAFENMMADFIQNEAPEQLKTKLLQSLQHGNERNLNYRLKDLIRNLNSDTKLFLFNNHRSVPHAFLKQLVDTRNYLTHYDPRDKDIIETEDRYYAIQRLKAFITVLLFKELGLPEEFILVKLRENRKTAFGLAQANLVLKN